MSYSRRLGVDSSLRCPKFTADRFRKQILSVGIFNKREENEKWLNLSQNPNTRILALFTILVKEKRNGKLKHGSK
jgi:hypothetical protein